MGDSVQDDDTETLRKKLINNEKTISELREQLRQLRISEHNQLRARGDQEIIRDLEGKKEVLENENEKLKKKIKWLEEDIQYFSTKTGITDLQNKIQEKDDQLNDMEKSLREKMDEMKKLMEEKMEKEMRAMKEDSKQKMEKMSQEMCAMKEDSKQKMEKMSQDIKFFSSKANKNEKELNDSKDRIKQLEESRDRLYIGQMCTDIEENIYWNVLPSYFEQPQPYYQPRVKYIIKNIDKLCETNTSKREAKLKWSDLQSKIGWQPNFVTVMEEFLNERNENAHPDPLKKAELEKIASRLTGQKQEHCQNLIKVWEKLI